eukprot:c11090_g1_i2.p1 GENE.c11090_g1_i2~~c11090_g1_i2.p1  ORF type:complete len:779 (-),score=144.15 c11090_g1_i2:165-2501(-)
MSQRRGPTTPTSALPTTPRAFPSSRVAAAVSSPRAVTTKTITTSTNAGPRSPLTPSRSSLARKPTPTTATTPSLSRASLPSFPNFSTKLPDSSSSQGSKPTISILNQRAPRTPPTSASTSTSSTTTSGSNRRSAATAPQVTTPRRSLARESTGRARTVAEANKAMATPHAMPSSPSVARSNVSSSPNLARNHSPVFPSAARNQPSSPSGTRITAAFPSTTKATASFPSSSRVIPSSPVLAQDRNAPSSPRLARAALSTPRNNPLPFTRSTPTSPTQTRTATAFTPRRGSAVTPSSRSSQSVNHAVSSTPTPSSPRNSVSREPTRSHPAVISPRTIPKPTQTTPFPSLTTTPVKSSRPALSRSSTISRYPTPPLSTPRRSSLGDPSFAPILIAARGMSSPRIARDVAEPKSPTLLLAKRAFPTSPSARPPALAARTLSQPLLTRAVRQSGSVAPASPGPGVPPQWPVSPNFKRDQASKTTRMSIPAEPSKPMPVLHQIIAQSVVPCTFKPTSHRRPSITPSLPSSDSFGVSPERMPSEDSVMQPPTPPQPQPPSQPHWQPQPPQPKKHELPPLFLPNQLLSQPLPRTISLRSDTETSSPAVSPAISQFAVSAMHRTESSSSINSPVVDDSPTPRHPYVRAMSITLDARPHIVHKRGSVDSTAESLNSDRVSYASSPQKGEFDGLVACSEELSMMVKPASLHVSPMSRYTRRRSEPDALRRSEAMRLLQEIANSDITVIPDRRSVPSDLIDSSFSFGSLALSLDSTPELPPLSVSLVEFI